MSNVFKVERDFKRMAEKCAICKRKVEVTFLNKIRGTFVGKKAVCSECQSKYGKGVHIKLR